MSANPTTLTLVQQARAIKDGDLSAEVLVRAHLDRITAHDGVLGAYLALDADGALAAGGARSTRAQRERRSGRSPGCRSRSRTCS